MLNLNQSHRELWLDCVKVFDKVMEGRYNPFVMATKSIMLAHRTCAVKSVLVWKYVSAHSRCVHTSFLERNILFKKKCDYKQISLHEMFHPTNNQYWMFLGGDERIWIYWIRFKNKNRVWDDTVYTLQQHSHVYWTHQSNTKVSLTGQYYLGSSLTSVIYPESQLAGHTVNDMK